MAGAAMGTALKIGANAIAELTSIGGLELSADTIETTALDTADGYRTYIQGLRDGGEVSISGFFKGSDTNGQQALLTNLNDGSVDTYSIVFPTAIGYTWSFSGIVTGFSTGAELEDAVTFDATLKVTGKPTLAATA